MTIHLEYDETVELLKRAVAEKGEDYVYEKPDGEMWCSYFHGATVPGCIIGHVLAYKGVTLRDLESNTCPVSDLGDNGTIDADAKVINLLDAVQWRQDNGSSWGGALAYSLEDADDEA